MELRQQQKSHNSETGYDVDTSWQKSECSSTADNVSFYIHIYCPFPPDGTVFIFVVLVDKTLCCVVVVVDATGVQSSLAVCVVMLKYLGLPLHVWDYVFIPVFAVCCSAFFFLWILIQTMCTDNVWCDRIAMKMCDVIYSWYLHCFFFMWT